jgi:hypothetical protein
MKLLLVTTLALGLRHFTYGDMKEKEYELDMNENNDADDFLIPFGNNSFIIPFQFFKQKVDNFEHCDNRTFLQKYYVDDRFYKPEGPVFLSLTGEWALPYLVTTDRLERDLVTALAKRYDGLVIGLEHRYYGQTTSIPVGGDLRDPFNLKYLTVDQALADTANFIQNFNLQNPNDYKLNNITKWMVTGGSYAGNLAAWMKLLYPDLVFGAHSSSGPFLAKLDFWEYSDAVRLGLSQSGGSEKCVVGWIRAVRIFDKFLSDTNETFVKEYFNAPEGYSIKDLASLTTVFSTTVQYGAKFADGNLQIVAITLL